MYSDFFTTYDNTTPPDVIPKGYQEVLDNLKRFLTDFPSFTGVSLISDSKPDEPFNFGTIITLNNPVVQAELQRLLLFTTSTNRIVETARLYLGGRYSWGGSTPSTGFDCSGFVLYVYKQNGITLPRTVKELEKTGLEISLTSAEPGDLICSSTSGPSGKHVKMVSKVENGLIYTIDARGKKKGIVEEPLTDTSKITTVRRVKYNASSNKFRDFVRTMYPLYLEVIKEKGLNSKIIPYLIKQDALESNYGKSPRGNGFNLGGIKGEPPNATKGPDGQYYRNFKNLKEYVSYKVDLLNRRYNAFAATSEEDFVNRLHGQNPTRSKYSANRDHYLRSFRGLVSLSKELSKV